MFKFRENRELLVDSMLTVRNFQSRSELIDYLQAGLDAMVPNKYDCSRVVIEKYGNILDARINWDTYIVHLEGYGVLGFTDGGVEE